MKVSDLDYNKIETHKYHAFNQILSWILHYVSLSSQWILNIFKNIVKRKNL